MTSLAVPTFDPATVHREVLPNGLTVLVRRDASAPVVAIVTYVKAGYFDESDDVVGIAHVLEHMFFKGTPTRGVGEIAKETKASGGYLNASTIYDHTVYYTVLPSASFGDGLGIQSDAYANSVIDAAELAKELEVIIQEAKRKADNPSAVSTETLFELLHDTHRVRRWRIGREPGLRALRREDLVRFYRTYYRPSNTILSIVGDVDVDDAVRMLAERYGSLADQPVPHDHGPDETGEPRFRYRELAGDIAQPELVFGWRTVPALHEDTPLLDAAAAVLGAGRASRLYRAVRERQLASSVGAYHYTPTDIGVFVMNAETPEETPREAAGAMWKELARLRDEGVNADEIARAQRLFESRWLRRLETMEGQANHLAEWEALGDWTLGDRYFERMTTLGADEVTDAARRWLDPDAAGFIAYRPERVETIAPDIDAARAMLDAYIPPRPPERSERSTMAAPWVTTHPPLERVEGQVRIYRTAGGVPILVRRRPGAPITYVGVYERGGSSIEPPERAGLYSMLGRVSLKGTMQRDAARIAEDAELLGASIGPSVTSDGFGWTLSVPSPRAAFALELLADVALHPTIPEDALETERKVALSDLAMLRDDMYRYPVRLATETAWAGHPYARSTLGDETTLSAITADDLRAWHRARVLEAPLVIAVVGDVEPDEFASLASGLFAPLVATEPPALAAPAWPGELAQLVESRDKAQTALALVFPAPSRRESSRFAAAMISGVASGLGGRFFDELRDRQSLAYTVQAFASDRLLGGMFVSYIATSPDQEERAREGLLAEFGKLRETAVSDDELSRAKTYALGTHAIRQQSGGAVLGDLVDAWLYGDGLGELDLFDERVRAVTAEEMRELARRDFDPERRVEGIVRGTGRKV
jgi:zinc protease